MINIAVLGHGVVGSGVVEVLEKNSQSIGQKAGEQINLKYILDLRDFPESPYRDKFVKDFEIIANDPEIKVVVEVMGGVSPAFEFASRCLSSGKSIVTSNKELVAAKGDVLLALAKENNANFLFEASVAGGIPIIRPISQCLAANEVFEISGILNGTTNFILAKMIKDGMEFSEALSLAQQLGYAEKNPAADIEGHDACRKICILASLAFGYHVYPDEVYTEGITKITLEDVRCAELFGGAIKLIASVKRNNDGTVFIVTAPMIVSFDSQLAHIDGVYNAVLVRGDAIGDVVFSGRGAGKLPTASAVVGDVIDSVKHLKARKYLYWDKSKTGYVRDINEDIASFYVRAKASDSTKAIAGIKEIFGEVQIVLEENGEIVFKTSVNTVGETYENLKKLEQNGCEILSRIRFFDIGAEQ